MLTETDIRTIIALINFFQCFEMEGEKKDIEIQMKNISTLKIKCETLINKN